MKDYIYFLYSILINGQSYGFFSSTQGLRQDDPISPSLFNIAAEVFSRGLKCLYSNYAHLSYHTTRGAPMISHLAYADDILLFCNRAATH